MAFLERANDPELGTSGGAPPRSASALYDVIKYLQLEHEKVFADVNFPRNFVNI